MIPLPNRYRVAGTPSSPTDTCAPARVHQLAPPYPDAERTRPGQQRLSREAGSQGPERPNGPAVRIASRCRAQYHSSMGVPHARTKRAGAICICRRFADVAQLVEHFTRKVGAARFARVLGGPCRALIRCCCAGWTTAAPTARSLAVPADPACVCMGCTWVELASAVP